MINYDFTITQGSDWFWGLSGFDTLDNASFTMQLRAEQNRDSDLLLEATPFFSIDDTTLRFNCPKDVTETLKFSKAYYDIFYNDGSNTIRLMYGCVLNNNQITFYEESS